MNIYTLHKEGSFQPPPPEGDNEILGLIQSTIRNGNNSSSNLPTVVEETTNQGKSSSHTSKTGRSGESVSSSGDKTAHHKNNSARNGNRRLDDTYGDIDGDQGGAENTAVPKTNSLGGASPSSSGKRESGSRLANKLNNSAQDLRNSLYSANNYGNHKKFASSLIEIQAKNEFMVFDNDTDLVSHLTNPPEIRTSPLEDEILIVDLEEFAELDDQVSAVSLPKALKKSKSKKKGSSSCKSRSNSSRQNFDEDGNRLDRRKSIKKSSSKRKSKSTKSLSVTGQDTKEAKKSSTARQAKGKLERKLEVSRELKSVKSLPTMEAEDTEGIYQANSHQELSATDRMIRSVNSEPIMGREENELPQIRPPTFCRGENSIPDKNDSSHKSHASSGKVSSKTLGSTRRGGKRHKQKSKEALQEDSDDVQNLGQSLFRKTSSKKKSSAGATDETKTGGEYIETIGTIDQQLVHSTLNGTNAMEDDQRSFGMLNEANETSKTHGERSTQDEYLMMFDSEGNEKKSNLSNKEYPLSPCNSNLRDHSNASKSSYHEDNIYDAEEDYSVDEIQGQQENHIKSGDIHQEFGPTLGAQTTQSLPPSTSDKTTMLKKWWQRSSKTIFKKKKKGLTTTTEIGRPSDHSQQHLIKHAVRSW